MGRKTDPKCLYCAKNYDTEDEAQAKHPDCYVTKNRVCYYKRYRIRNSGKINAQRRDSRDREQGIGTLEPILPNDFRVEFVVYGIRHQSVHALGFKIYQGSKLCYKMPPQHLDGLSSIQLKDYVRKIMAHLEDNYGIDRLGQYYWKHSKYCPTCTGDKF